MSTDDRGRSDRRSFLKALGGAVGAAALAPGSASAQTAAGAVAPSSNDYDVIVIGGGFAGVTAARELRHAGLRTLILEARNRLGGRTFTTRVGGEVFELGGTWIHSTQPSVFAEASRYGCELVDTTGGLPQQALWWDGEQVREAGLSGIPALVREAICSDGEEGLDVPLSVLQALALLSSQAAEFHAGARAAFPRPFEPFFTEAWKQADTLSVRDRLDEMGLAPAQRGLLEGVLGASAHGDFSEASFVEMLRWWALSGNDLERYSDSVARYRLRDGTDGLIRAMVEDGRPDIKLGTPVVEVNQNGEQVELLTQRGERFTARAAIAALPMNVLANIRFTPALHPDKVAASRERHAAAGTKVYIRLGEPLPSTSIFAPESEPFSSILGFEGHAPGRELVAFGTDPSRIDVHSRKAVQAELRRFLPGVTVTDTLAYDWHLDPYSLGTWCVLRKGQMTRYLAKLREPHGSVHFAGGDIALGWRGFIDGAIESGNRVAHELIDRLQGRGEPAQSHASAPAADIGEDSLAFQSCAVCHPTDSSGGAGVGPNLRGVLGRPTASDPRYPYSAAMRGRGGEWSEEQLDAFLTDPAAHVPGTTMPFAGLKDPADRAAVIRFLRGLE